MVNTFSSDYRGHYFNIAFIHHPKGIIFKVKVDDLTWCDGGDTPSTTYEDAKNDAITCAKTLIDDLVK